MLLSCWQLGQILWKRDLVRFHSNRMSLFHSILRLGGKLSLRTYDEGAFAINCDSCADNPCLKWLVVLWHEYIFLVCSWKVWIFISGASIAWIHTWFVKYSSTCVGSHLWFCTLRSAQLYLLHEAIEWANRNPRRRRTSLERHVSWLDENLPAQVTVVPYCGRLFNVQLSFNQDHTFVVIDGAFPLQ